VLFSSKPALGNLLAGAPAVDIILGMRMIEHGIIPATGVESGPENIMSRRIKHPKRIISNCQSYEGQCASFIIEAV
jgi:3-oxoacyl-(acyl-carrier-protein) synthase